MTNQTHPDLPALVAKWRESAERLRERGGDRGKDEAQGIYGCADELEAALLTAPRAEGEAVAWTEDEVRYAHALADETWSDSRIRTLTAALNCVLAECKSSHPAPAAVEPVEIPAGDALPLESLDPCTECGADQGQPCYPNPVCTLTTPAPATRGEWVMVRADVVAFLSGSGELDGKWWGEKNASDKPYWWRRYLRERPAAPKQDSVGVDEAMVERALAAFNAMAAGIELRAYADPTEPATWPRDMMRAALTAALGQAGGGK